MKLWRIGLTLVFVTVVLVGCDSSEATPAAAGEGFGETYTSDTLDTSYPDALAVRSQLALGTIQLEETENSVTPEQAAALLPLWQALRGGVTIREEVDALLKQIEGTMTVEQLEAIAAMRLTQDDLRAWAQSQGAGMPPEGGAGRGEGGQEMSPEARATRQAEFAGGEGMPPEMATRRAEFADMSEEEREAFRATAQAGGGMPGRPGGPGGGPGAGPGQFGILLDPLIELLTERAAE